MTGSIIGTIGATAFVLINRSELPGAWPEIALGAWLVALAVTIFAVFVRPRRLTDPGPPGPYAGLIYSGSIAGMLALMAIGRVVLDAVDRPELQPAVVVIAVGAHFVPFAKTFNVPIFATLGWTVTALGVIGLLSGLIGGAVPAAVAATLTGIVMLTAIARSAWTQ
ncbi:hypothetical protein [Demetria terragena]|uniref:hypothetical protein n=1 Tax=Demetria terragena TaxID=63959 RepID=UPI0014616CDE|nr:hypothetical protein [Demetria terragena]